MTQYIDTITTCTTQMLDVLDEMSCNNAHPEFRRKVALAKTNIEQGSMWAIKALNTDYTNPYTLNAYTPEMPGHRVTGEVHAGPEGPSSDSDAPIA
jgi:hypothetical protein